MATLATIQNLVVCGLSASLGTGTKGCIPFFKKVTAIWLTPQGFKYDKAQTFDEAYINTLQTEGNLIVLKGIRTFTDNTGDDVIDELDDGTKQVARLGLYEFAVNFINGLYYHAALHSLNSFKNYDATFIDRDGNVLGTLDDDGESMKGFTIGMLQGMKFQWPTDSTGQREGLMLQLLERVEFDTDYVFVDKDSLTFRPNRIDGINEIVVSYPTVPVAGLSITLKAKRKQDGAPFTGLPFANWLLTKGGATSNPTAGDDSVTPGTYVLTVAAFVASDALTASIYDNSGNKSVIDLGGDLYKSNTASTVAV